jgi:rhamnogalacturonyl hydrolase YesR
MIHHTTLGEMLLMNKKSLVKALAIALAGSALAGSSGQAAAASSIAKDPPSKAAGTVLASAERLAEWQLAHLPAAPSSAPLPAGVDPATAEFFRMESLQNPRSWHQATFWLGLTALAERTSSPRLRDAILDFGKANQWKPGDRIYNADDHLIGRTYLWASRHGAGRQVTTPLRQRFDQILVNPPRTHLALYVGAEGMRAIPRAECLKRWCWADAIFMAPATWIGLSRETGDRRYRDYAISEFWAASNFLYDPAERLYFRDSRFFDLRDEANRKIFWSRGNGWVLAGLAQMLEVLPPRDPERARIEAHFREFAGRVVKLQKADGYWPSSLLTTADSSPETSGSALFTYALARGVANGVLPRAEYEPAVRLGWQALQAAIQPSGALGWVQAAGDRPGPSSATSTQIYATGAYLLAAAAISDLDRKH